MNKQINLRLPKKILVNAENYAKEHGFCTIQELIKEILRQRLFEEPSITKEELTLIRKLAEISERKNFFGTEEELFRKLRG